MAALVLVSAYSGVLLSFIMSPVSKPVVDSIYDIVDVPDLKVAVDRGMAADLVLRSVRNDKSLAYRIICIQCFCYRLVKTRAQRLAKW